MKSDSYDVVVIGGGPAGMMAAATAADRGKRVLLLEKNKSLGKKLLITGGGRCNVTNNRPVVRDLVGAYGAASKFLFSTFSQFAVKETIAYFADRAVLLKEENEGRMFPVSNSAATIHAAQQAHLKESGVSIMLGQSVSKVTVLPQQQFSIQVGIKEIAAKSCVVATGGTSRPETGSTGDGFAWLRMLGHTVEKDTQALVPLTIFDSWVHSLGGVTVPDVNITVFLDGDKQTVKRGKILFTHVGVSGPTVLNLSHQISELLPAGTVTLSLDLFPDFDMAGTRVLLQQSLVTLSNKKVKNVLATLVPAALVSVLLEQAGIDGETPAHSVRSAERVTLVARLKSLTMTVSGLLGTEKAVVSGGGVDLREINFKTMESRLVPGLFLVGDILNINRPSGGYSLQLCWSTGYVAGCSV